MTREQRAKQFAPFDALKGLQDALKEKERKHLLEERKEISEDLIDSNAKVLFVLEKGDNVIVNFYLNGRYCEETGLVDGNNKTDGFLIIKNIVISYDDIYTIEKI